MSVRFDAQLMSERGAEERAERKERRDTQLKSIAMAEHLVSSQPGPLPTLILMRNSNFTNNTKDCRPLQRKEMRKKM